MCNNNGNTHQLLVTSITLAIAVFVTIAHLKAPLHHRTNIYEHITVALWLPFGAVVCYSLNHYLQFGPIMAATTVGLAGSFLPQINKKSSYLKQVPVAIYCGTFIGMSNTTVAPNLTFVCIAAVIATVLFVYAKTLFFGLGGKLGMLSFIAVAITSFLSYLIVLWF